MKKRTFLKELFQEEFIYLTILYYGFKYSILLIVYFLFSILSSNLFLYCITHYDTIKKYNNYSDIYYLAIIIISLLFALLSFTLGIKEIHKIYKKLSKK